AGGRRLAAGRREVISCARRSLVAGVSVARSLVAVIGHPALCLSPGPRRRRGRRRIGQRERTDLPVGAPVDHTPFRRGAASPRGGNIPQVAPPAAAPATAARLTQDARGSTKYRGLGELQPGGAAPAATLTAHRPPPY